MTSRNDETSGKISDRAVEVGASAGHYHGTGWLAGDAISRS
jgi:hypothetical protein